MTPDVHFITALVINGSGTTYFAFNSSNTSQHVLSAIDVAFFDWKNAFGVPLEIWLGRFGGNPPGPTYPVQFGPFGLLFNTTGDTWEDTVGTLFNNSADGIRASLRLSQLADLKIQGVWIRIAGNLGAFSSPSGEDMYGGDISFKVIDGLRVGGYYVANSITNAGSVPFTGPSPLGTLFHLYGPAAGSLNPATARCPGSGPGTPLGGSAAVGGINCPALGNGWGAYVEWDVLPGLGLDVEAAQWTDLTPGGGTDYGYNAVATIDLGKLADVKGLTISLGYAYYGPNFYSPYGAAELDIWGWDLIYPGNAQGFTANLAWNVLPPLTIFGDYTTGNHVSNSQNITAWRVGVGYSFAPNARITVFYRDDSINGVDQINVYRAQFDYRF